MTIEHIFYLLNHQCYLTLKADGYYKEDIIEEVDKICEYESIGNRKYIFNIQNKKGNIQDKLFELADELKVNYPKMLKEELNIDNIESIISCYTSFYEKFNSNIIPKFYLKINKSNFIGILNFISNYFPNNGFPNDGWVVVPENEQYIAKLKPTNHLTIDLKYQNNKFFANRWIEVNAYKRNHLKNNSVYRCYWEDNKWFAKEERTDKKFGNSNYIIELITNYLERGYNLNYFKNENVCDYYDHKTITNEKYIEYFKFMKEYAQNWISNLSNIENKTKILDIGCGKKASYNMLTELGFKNIVGIDSDPICILKSMIASRSNNYIWIDINYDWSIREQIKRFGQLWHESQLFKLNHLFSKFDTILFNFSIFYCHQDKYELLVGNLNKVSKIGTKLFFNYIDYNLANDKLIDEFDIEEKNLSIKLKLPWLNNFHIEPKFNNNKFTELLTNNNWELVNKCKINEKHNNFQDWQDLFVYQVWEKY